MPLFGHLPFPFLPAHAVSSFFRARGFASPLFVLFLSTYVLQLHVCKIINDFSHRENKHRHVTENATALHPRLVELVFYLLLTSSALDALKASPTNQSEDNQVGSCEKKLQNEECVRIASAMLRGGRVRPSSSSPSQIRSADANATEPGLVRRLPPDRRRSGFGVPRHGRRKWRHGHGREVPHHGVQRKIDVEQ